MSRVFIFRQLTPTAFSSWSTVTVSMLALAILLCCASASRATVAQLGDVSSFSLDNGLNVVVIADHRLPVVTHMVWYRVGSADEVQGSSGLAHYVEHLMFKSCNASKTESFSQIISRLGGLDNAFTNHDTTHYFQRVPKDRLRDVMALEAQRMARLDVTEAEARAERQVVAEERRSNVESDPVKILNEQMLALLHHNHRYGVPAVGWSHEIETLTLEQALTFHRRHYGPNNTTVVVAGDITVDEVRKLAVETYGKVARNDEIVATARAHEPEPRVARRLHLDDRRAARPALFRYYLTPSYATANGLEAESIDLLMRIVGGGETSRLAQALVSESKVASITGATYFGDTRDDGRIAVFAITGADNDLGKLEAALDKVLADVAKNGVTADELQHAKLAVETSTVFESDNQKQLAERYGEALSLGLTVDDVKDVPSRIASVTVADVNKVAGKYLTLRRSVTGLMSRRAHAAANKE